jgi:drug/metabolite transporter (DMT)-like permease
MSRPENRRLRAILTALFVTVLWSSSWVLIKIGLRDIPALSFAGLRYAIAFLVLLPFLFRRGRPASLRALPARGWIRLVALGITFYALTQGAQYVSLSLIPAMTVSLLLSFSAALTAVFGAMLLRESPSPGQWLGIGIYLAGVAVYFLPFTHALGSGPGILVALLCVAANVASSLLGRSVNREAALDPLSVTTVTMGIGAALLLTAGVAFQGIPRLSLQAWAILLWLAVVNGAVAYTLWNLSLKDLTATESSMINNTMLFQIAILAWAFLDEGLGWKSIAGIVVAAAGTALAQMRSIPRRGRSAS